MIPFKKVNGSSFKGFKNMAFRQKLFMIVRTKGSIMLTVQGSRKDNAKWACGRVTVETV